MLFENSSEIFHSFSLFFALAGEPMCEENTVIVLESIDKGSQLLQDKLLFVQAF